jgi:hypothetical protein
MNSEATQFAQVSYLVDNLEVLVKHLKQYFKIFGLNTTSSYDCRYTEGSNNLAEIIHDHYEVLLKTAICLGFPEPKRELTTNLRAQNSPRDIVFGTLHEIVMILPAVEARLENKRFGAAEVLKFSREQSMDEDTERAVKYGAYVLRVRNWHMVLIHLDQALDRPSLPPMLWNSYIF